MPNPNLKDHAVKFGYGQDPTKGGRPKKIYTILKEKGYCKEDIKTAFGELTWYTLKELKELHQDESKPVIMRIIANQLFLTLKKGDWSKVKEIMEHVLGKPTQPLANDESSPLIQSTPVVFADGRTLEDVMKEIKE